MSRALIGFGSNQGDRFATLQNTRNALKHLPHTTVLQVSPLYETLPVGYAQQPNFLNSVILVETALSPHALLGACLGIEVALGRVRTFANAPRTLDLDLLLYEGIHLETPELTLPHPRMTERAFVMVPLFDLFPDKQPFGFDFTQIGLSHEGINPIEL